MEYSIHKKICNERRRQILSTHQELDESKLEHFESDSEESQKKVRFRVIVEDHKTKFNGAIGTIFV